MSGSQHGQPVRALPPLCLPGTPSLTSGFRTLVSEAASSPSLASFPSAVVYHWTSPLLRIIAATFRLFSLLPYLPLSSISLFAGLFSPLIHSLDLVRLHSLVSYCFSAAIRNSLGRAGWKDRALFMSKTSAIGLKISPSAYRRHSCRPPLPRLSLSPPTTRMTTVSMGTHPGSPQATSITISCVCPSSSNPFSHVTESFLTVFWDDDPAAVLPFLVLTKFRAAIC